MSFVTQIPSYLQSALRVPRQSNLATSILHFNNYLEFPVMSHLRVLIVGASVAGPTAAYWLAKAGANVTIIERFPKLRTNGQAIDIRTASVTVMRKMPGMEAAVRTKTVPMDGFSCVHENG